MDWDAKLYDRFADERTRPARDLLARVFVREPRDVIDLGCGTGTSTELLARHWPDAELVGIDSSPAMLAAGHERVPAARFEQGDVEGFATDLGPNAQRFDVVFANAVLHWVPDHASLLPRLLERVAPGGALALQVPDNGNEPSHQLMREVAEDVRWREQLARAAEARTKISSLEQLHAWLARDRVVVDVWRTTYVHALAGPDAIVDWFRATGLRPFLAPLDEARREDFLAAYVSQLARAYPRDAGGRVLLRFPRTFAVAHRTDHPDHDEWKSQHG
jgi:trans-aconitate 2-methyltransferase